MSADKEAIEKVRRDFTEISQTMEVAERFLVTAGKVNLSIGTGVRDKGAEVVNTTLEQFKPLKALFDSKKEVLESGEISKEEFSKFQKEYEGLALMPGVTGSCLPHLVDGLYSAFELTVEEKVTKILEEDFRLDSIQALEAKKAELEELKSQYELFAELPGIHQEKVKEKVLKLENQLAQNVSHGDFKKMMAQASAYDRALSSKPIACPVEFMNYPDKVWGMPKVPSERSEDPEFQAFKDSPNASVVKLIRRAQEANKAGMCLGIMGNKYYHANAQSINHDYSALPTAKMEVLYAEGALEDRALNAKMLEHLTPGMYHDLVNFHKRMGNVQIEALKNTTERLAQSEERDLSKYQVARDTGAELGSMIGEISNISKLPGDYGYMAMSQLLRLNENIDRAMDSEEGKVGAQSKAPAQALAKRLEIIGRRSEYKQDIISSQLEFMEEASKGMEKLSVNDAKFLQSKKAALERNKAELALIREAQESSAKDTKKLLALKERENRLIKENSEHLSDFEQETRRLYQHTQKRLEEYQQLDIASAPSEYKVAKSRLAEANGISADLEALEGIPGGHVTKVSEDARNMTTNIVSLRDHMSGLERTKEQSIDEHQEKRSSGEQRLPFSGFKPVQISEESLQKEKARGRLGRLWKLGVNIVSGDRFLDKKFLKVLDSNILNKEASQTVTQKYNRLMASGSLCPAACTFNQQEQAYDFNLEEYRIQIPEGQNDVQIFVPKVDTITGEPIKNKDGIVMDLVRVHKDGKVDIHEFDPKGISRISSATKAKAEEMNKVHEAKKSKVKEPPKEYLQHTQVSSSDSGDRAPKPGVKKEEKKLQGVKARLTRVRKKKEAVVKADEIRRVTEDRSANSLQTSRVRIGKVSGKRKPPRFR